jgi:hypothetical protein
VKSRVWKDDPSGDPFYIVESDEGTEVTISPGPDGTVWLNINMSGSLFLDADEVEEVVRFLLKASLTESKS